MIREELPQTAILVLSAHVEVEHAMDLSSGERIGYLLKSRVTDVDDFSRRSRDRPGGSVIDPALVQELVAPGAQRSARRLCAARARGARAHGRRPSNAGIAGQLWVTEGTVEKHVRSILMKLRLPETEDDHRRVLAWSPTLTRASSRTDCGSPSPTPPTSRESPVGLASIASARSASDRVEIRITEIL